MKAPSPFGRARNPCGSPPRLRSSTQSDQSEKRKAREEVSTPNGPETVGLMETIPQERAPQNRLADLVIGLTRAISKLRDESRDERSRLGDLFRGAVEFAAESERRYNRLQARYLDLLAQHRALVSGRTNAAERQALDEAAVMTEVLADETRMAA